MNKEKGIFRGWLVVFSGLILMIFVYGIVNNCVSLFIKPVTEDLGFTRSEFSLYYTISALSMMMIAPFIGKISRKIKLRYIVLIGCISSGIGFIGYSYSNTLSMFYIFSILTGIGLGFSTIVSLSIIINNWFIKKRGLALGLAFMGSGVGGMIFNPIANYIIINNGWRSAYFVLGIILLVGTIPIVILFLHDKPEDKNLKPYGYEENNNTDFKELKGLLLKDALKTKYFWVMLVGMFLISSVAMGIQMHLASYLTDIGYSQTYAANVISINMGVIVVGKILLGSIFDKLGCKKGVIFVSIQILIALTALLFIENKVITTIFIVCWGLGNCMGTIVPPLLTSELFGSKDYSTIIGVVNISVLLGAAVGPTITAKIYETSGTYNTAWAVYIALSVVMMMLVLLSLSMSKSSNENIENTRGI